MSDGAYLYILRCADGSYYTGTARSGLEQRIAEHNAGTYGGYTAQRRPGLASSAGEAAALASAHRHAMNIMICDQPQERCFLGVMVGFGVSTPGSATHFPRPHAEEPHEVRRLEA